MTASTLESSASSSFKTEKHGRLLIQPMVTGRTWRRARPLPLYDKDDSPHQIVAQDKGIGRVDGRFPFPLSSQVKS